MSVETAGWVVSGIGAYAAIGLVFALLFLSLRVKAIDPDAAEGSLGFRLIVLPGTIALWPLFAWRWARGVDAAPEPRDPHRRATSGSAP